MYIYIVSVDQKCIHVHVCDWCQHFVIETFRSGVDMPDGASSATHLTLREYSYHVLGIGCIGYVDSM